MVLEFPWGFMKKNLNCYIEYTPEYRDYKELNERDRLVHPVNMGAQWAPTRKTELLFDAVYNGDSETYQSETVNSFARIQGRTRWAKHIESSYGYRYEDLFERQVRTGTFVDRTRNSAFADMVRQYGSKSRVQARIGLVQDSYDSGDDDSYTEVEPSGRWDHWLTPLTALESNLAYRYRDFDDRGGDEDTITGDVRYVKLLTKNFDIYGKYRHSYSETDAARHHVFHPSVGFDWAVDETSGVSVGLGILFHDWSNDNDEDPDPFLDVNAFKHLQFSKRMRLSLAGRSAYSESNDDASSLGYNISYDAGARFEYRLTKQMTTHMQGGIRITEYGETAQDRSDQRLNLGAGLSWTPLKWLEFGIEYRYTDFQTNADLREDYAQNTALFTIRLIPETPARIEVPDTRDVLESLIFY